MSSCHSTHPLQTPHQSHPDTPAPPTHHGSDFEASKHLSTQLRLLHREHKTRRHGIHRCTLSGTQLSYRCCTCASERSSRNVSASPEPASSASLCSRHGAFRPPATACLRCLRPHHDPGRSNRAEARNSKNKEVKGKKSANFSFRQDGKTWLCERAVEKSQLRPLRQGHQNSSPTPRSRYAPESLQIEDAKLYNRRDPKAGHGKCQQQEARQEPQGRATGSALRPTAAPIKSAIACELYEEMNAQAPAKTSFSYTQILRYNNTIANRHLNPTYLWGAREN